MHASLRTVFALASLFALAACQDRDFLHYGKGPQLNALSPNRPRPIPTNAAPEPLYAHSENTLYAIDWQSFAVTEVSDFRGEPSESIFDIAICRNGKLYGIQDRTVFAIDPRTAELTPLDVEIPVSGNGLTCLSNGMLVVSGEKIAFINPATGKTRVLHQKRPYLSSGDIIALPDGFLYETTIGAEEESDVLVRIDPLTGKTKKIGEIGFTDVYGLGYAYGKLYGFDSEGNILRINLATGRGTVLSRTSIQFAGATTNPVFW